MAEEKIVMRESDAEYDKLMVVVPPMKISERYPTTPPGGGQKEEE